MDPNPYQSPMLPSKPANSKPPSQVGTDWFALGGLFVGSIASVVTGSILAANSAYRPLTANRYRMSLLVIGIIAITTIGSWVLGRIVRRNRVGTASSSE